MKKIFMIFMVFFITMPAFATSGEPIDAANFKELTHPDFIENEERQYMKEDKCKIKSRTNDRANEYLYAARTTTGPAYEADTSDCPHNTQICISGYSTVEYKTKTNHCWHADVRRGLHGDSWESDKKIDDCSGGKWTQRGASKYPVFVNKYNKILVNGGIKADNIIASLIGTDVVADFEVKCVAYVCVESDNSLSYGCKNGTCDENCPDDNNDDDNSSESDDDNSGGDNGGGGNSGGGSGNATSNDTKTPDQTKIHRNTVQPWLNALNSYRATCTK